jgi:hypothetical protein
MNISTLKKALLSLFWVACVSVAHAQEWYPKAQLTSDTALLALFEYQDELVWVRQYSGFLNESNTLHLMLGFDGVRVRGYLTYPNSTTRLQVDGTLRYDSLILDESGLNGSTCARWEGHLSGHQLSATWRTADGSRGGYVEMSESSATPVDNNWMNRYVARWNNFWVELALMRTSTGALTGALYLDAERETVLLKGDIDQNGYFLLETPLPDGEASVELSGQMRYLQVAKATWRASNGELRTYKLQLRDNMLTQRVEYADYQSNIDIVLPQTRCQTCNVSLEQQARTWIESAKKAAATTGLLDVPANRSIRRANGWTELVQWDDRFLSGFVLFRQSVGDTLNRGLAFTFDLDEDRIVDLGSLFIKNFDWQSWLQDHARREATCLYGPRRLMHEHVFSSDLRTAAPDCALDDTTAIPQKERSGGKVGWTVKPCSSLK